MRKTLRSVLYGLVETTTPTVSAAGQSLLHNLYHAKDHTGTWDSRQLNTLKTLERLGYVTLEKVSSGNQKKLVYFYRAVLTTAGQAAAENQKSEG